MKRRPEDDDDPNSSPESRAEEFAERILSRSRKLLKIGGIILAIVIIIALVLSRF